MICYFRQSNNKYGQGSTDRKVGPVRIFEKPRADEKSGPWIPVQSINDAIYRLTLGYTFEIDQSPSYGEIVAVVRGLRSAAWLSALSMKTSANREIEIGKLIIQEEYFLTNIYGALSEEYDLGNSTENISRIKAGVRLILVE